MDYQARGLSSAIRRAARTFPAILVTGPRQSGKTTLLRTQFGESHRYVSLERPDVRERASADPLGFFREARPPLILDEIQYAPDLLHYVKDAIDEDRAPGRWLLSGSQSFPLMQGVSQTLAGRVAVLRLDPLSTEELYAPGPGRDFGELLRQVFGEARPVDEAPRLDLVDWILRGGYPEPRLNQEVDRGLWFSSYVQTYLERDVRDLIQVTDLGAFSRFLALVASRTGAVLNLSELGREAGITAPTAKRWLSVLETSQVICLLQPYHANLGKRIRRSPKLYMLDPGLASFLLGVHSRETVLGGPSLGALTETVVVSEWMKAARQRGIEPKLYYWQASSGLEVDLIIEHDGRLHAIEVKATATPSPRHGDNLARWLQLIGGDAKGVVACQVATPTALRPGIRAVPWHLAW